MIFMRLWSPGCGAGFGVPQPLEQRHTIATCAPMRAVEMRAAERGSALAVLALDPADRAGAGAHDHAFGGHQPAAQALDPVEQRAVGDPGGGEDAVAFRKVVELVDPAQV